MKKFWLLCSAVFIVGVMIFVLFNRKAAGDRKAMAANQNVFTAVSTMEVRKQALQASVTKVYKVQVNVSEKEAFQLKTGDRAVAETDVYPGIQFGGRIQSISGKSDNAHTVPVEVVISDTKEHPLKSGIFGRVTFQLAGKDSALTIPRDALAGSVKNPQVYVVENGMAKLRDIVIGSEYDTVLEVIGGLKEHELVVVSGQDYLKDNAAVKVTGDAESNQ